MLTLGRKVMTKKQRYYFANKSPCSQGYGFPVVMYGCESWTIKKTEHRRIDAFEQWYWRRFSRVFSRRKYYLKITYNKKVSQRYPVTKLIFLKVSFLC